MGNDQSCLTALDLALPGAATAFQPADMRNATGVITGATIDWSVACTASETRMCHVAKRPSTWNEFLYPLNLRLRDWSGSCGQLCLESFDDFVGEASAEILHQALTVLHLLLKTHRCVSAVDIYDDILKRNQCALLNVLCKNAFIKHLKVTSVLYSEDKNFPTVVSTSTHFEELELRMVSSNPFGYLESLPERLTTSTSDPEIKAFWTDLKANATIKELLLHESAIASAECRSMFASFLKKSSTLTTLTYTVEKFREDSLRLIHDSLLGNTTVSKLIIFLSPFCKMRLGIPNQITQVLADIVYKNTTLRSACITFEEFSNGPPKYPLLPTHQDWDYWMMAFEANDTLEEVFMPVLLWERECWASFFNSVAKKQQATEGDPARSDVEVLKCKSFSKTEVPALTSQTAILRILCQLSELTHITSLTLLVYPYRMNQELSSALAEFLGSTTALKSLALETAVWAKCPDGTWTVIFESLSENRSIRKLRVALDLHSQDTEHLGSVLKLSRNHSRVEIQLTRVADTDVFAKSMSSGIADNHVLLSICLETHFFSYVSDPHTRKEWFLVLDTARRNSSIVLRAAQFVTGLRSDRGGAEAVEDVFLYPELLEGLAEELSLPTIEAAALVRRGLQCLQSLDDFMRLAGVVKERVVCHRRDDGCLQLTDLGPDCWAVIRRYLLLCDIVDSII
ncbi:hypothetical protein HPB48_019881 [Haemaphysalis longicornis]|uniref:Uncharacterized protein n=1 Tax=Haemaphysalis longicornis TaxID=44386 RepID=A0A9J6GY29_HAELO|nr:hypothetical protein HPB48_019881 [Haemaphysalis longicornis]